jgi:hypothetical protein
MQMKARVLSAAAVVLLLAAQAFPHRLDQYLEATIVSVEKDGIHASVRLVPGVAVSSAVIASIDTNQDGVISVAEQWAYAERVLGDLSLAVDGERLNARLRSVKFPAIEEMKEGVGEIEIEFTAALPPGGGERRLVFENHHQTRIAAYLMNCLVPTDPGTRIVAQNRNEDQSIYQLDFVQADFAQADLGQASGRAGAIPGKGWRGFFSGWMSGVGFASLFRLGMRHIAEGTDHLLFLLALLLPAPLLVIGSRWGGFVGWRQSVLRILKVITAFTIGHSITLTLAALGVVYLPSRPVEALIALSIFVSAIHALRPIFPGREAMIAGSFGLIHGLAFAATLGQLGIGWWDRLGSILAFNVGIEAMQLLVIAAAMPSIILLSQTRAYSWLRVGGAVFAAIASLCWIGNRLLGMHTPVDAVVDGIARHGAWIAVGVFAISLLCWSLRNVSGKQASALQSVAEGFSPPFGVLVFSRLSSRIERCSVRAHGESPASRLTSQ